VRTMKVLCGFLALVALALSSGVARAQMIPDNVGQSSKGLPPALVNVGFDPQLNAQIPLDAHFVDEFGQPVTLRQYGVGKKPVVLVFAYYTCPMLCTEVERAVVGALKMISFNPGTDYEVVFVSFDPADTPDAALKKKHEALSRFARPATEQGWHFLTGSQESIEAVTKAASFRYSFDQQTRSFGHASGILILTPDGRISRYFFGVEYPPTHVRLGLVDASAGKIGTPVDHLLLFCYQYDPSRARYSATVLTVIRMGGVVTLLCMAIGFVIFRRREHHAASGRNSGPLSPAQGAD
jgi:protein SCO1